MRRASPPKILALIAALLSVGGCQVAEALLAGEPPRPPCSRRLGVPNHVPEYLRHRDTGRPLPLDTPLSLRVALKLRDEPGLDAFLAATAAPGAGPQRPMSRAQFAAAHLPSAEQIAEVAAALAAHGLRVDPAARGHLLHAEGTAGAVNAAFATTIVGGAEPSTYRPQGKITPPSEHILAVTGIGTPRLARQHGTEGSAAAALTPATLRSGYDLPAHLTGRRRRLALIELDGYDPADIAAYCQKFGLREVPRRAILLGGYDGRPVKPAGQAEATLDIQLMNAVVPDADEFVVISAHPDSNNALLDTFVRLANPEGDEPLVAHISCSWGRPETGMSQAAITAQDAALKQLAAQGQQVWAASGDNGAMDDGRVLSTDSPASSRWSVATGGTRLSLDGRGGWAEESSWGGSGGGLSCFWPTAPWQARAVAQKETMGMRAVPDVALHADPAPGHAVIIGGREQSVGGTSCAAPIFTAIAALADEAREAAGKPPLGFVAPWIYQVAAEPRTREAFHDIVTGHNLGPAGRKPGEAGFFALPGFDRTSGWGSPHGARLVDALVALP